MSIRIRCECGSRLEAPDELAGRQAVCGKCGRVLNIIADEESVVEIPASRTATKEPSEEALQLPRRVSRPKKKVFQPLAGGGAGDGADPAKRKPGRKKRRSSSADRTKRKGAPSLTDVWIRGLMFPFRREAVITIAVLSCLYGPVVGGLASAPAILLAGAMGPKTMAAMVLFTAGITGYFCYFLFQTLRAAAANEDDLPVAVAFDMEEIFTDLWLMLGGTAVIFSPLWLLRLLAFFTDTEIPFPVLASLSLFIMFLWPMAVTSSALQTSVLAANHWTVTRAVLKILGQYTSTLLLSLALHVMAYGIGFAVSYAFAEGLPDRWYIQGFAGIFSWYLEFTAVTACMYLAGNLYYRNRRLIGWFAELQQRY